MDKEASLLSTWLPLLRCPACQSEMDLANLDVLQCQCCGESYSQHHGIFRLLPSDSRESLQDFCDRYDAVRLREGWASDIPGYYTGLPEIDATNKHEKEWSHRAASFQLICRWIKARYGEKGRLRILDAGAGCCWMSRFLGRRYNVLALDINGGPHGLDALPLNMRNFLPVQAGMACIPLRDASLDLVVAAASLHYSEDFVAYIKEFRRVIVPGGYLLIVDSPVYQNEDSACAARKRTLSYYESQGEPGLAVKYKGLVRERIDELQGFCVSYLRHDLTRLALMKKAIVAWLGGVQRARFPVILAERLEEPSRNSAYSTSDC